MNQVEQLEIQQESQTKRMLGALVPEAIYRRFKSEAASRGELLQDAIYNAALLYIDISNQKLKEEGN